jgi:hypothetical protein
MSQNHKQAIGLVGLALAALTASCYAQVPPCKPFLITDTQIPTYPPLARVAHMTGTIRFTVLIAADGKAQISFLDGPNENAWQMLVSSAREYLSARKYGSFERSQPTPCTYTASVEYRIVGKPVDSPNNFMRVTVLDASHTVVEVKPTIEKPDY